MKSKLILCLALVLSGIGFAVHADEPLTSEQQDLCALLAKASPDSAHTNLPTISRRGGDYLTRPESERLVKLLRDPAVAKVVTRELALAAIQQRQIDDSLPGFEYDALMDIVNQRWSHDATVVAFYRQALVTRTEAAMLDLSITLPGIWDDSLVEPLIQVVEKNASPASLVRSYATPKQVSYFAIQDALIVLDRHYSVWATNASVPPRLSKAVLRIFSALTNSSLAGAEPGDRMWCNVVSMLVQSHDLAILPVLRPFLKNKTEVEDDLTGLKDRDRSPLRVCDHAALYISRLLGDNDFAVSWFAIPDEGIRNGTGSYRIWDEWDKKIAKLQKRLEWDEWDKKIIESRKGLESMPKN